MKIILIMEFRWFTEMNHCFTGTFSIIIFKLNVFQFFAMLTMRAEVMSRSALN